MRFLFLPKRDFFACTGWNNSKKKHEEMWDTVSFVGVFFCFVTWLDLPRFTIITHYVHVLPRRSLSKNTNTKIIMIFF